LSVELKLTDILCISLFITLCTLFIITNYNLLIIYDNCQFVTIDKSSLFINIFFYAINSIVRVVFSHKLWKGYKWKEEANNILWKNCSCTPITLKVERTQ
jgi:hypothetical protein